MIKKLSLNRETLTRLSLGQVRTLAVGYDDTGSDACSAQQCSQIQCTPPPSQDCVTHNPNIQCTLRSNVRTCDTCDAC